MSTFGKNNKFSDILLDWYFNSSYFNFSRFYNYNIKIIFCNEDYQYKTTE